MSEKKRKNNPSPEEIVHLAKECGYSEYRTSVSATLYFLQDNSIATSQDDDILLARPRVKIHVYYTTRGIMTMLGHPVSGTNQLWRSNAYQDLNDLKGFFENPRKHTGKGYREAGNAVRGCVRCGELKKRDEFSNNQWAKGPDENKCKECVGEELASKRTTKPGNEAAVVPEDELVEAMKNSLALTPETLARHNQTKLPTNEEYERRQFNCPDCPRHGRKPNVFYKRVPKFKPIVKCAICKKITKGRCKRLVAIPRDLERGYGLFKCSSKFCGRTFWGSSRALYGVGQECLGCKSKGRDNVMVPPFRMEVLKKTKRPSGRRPMVRVPKEPIAEDAPVEASYTPMDDQRNRSEASNALAGSSGGGGRETKSYEFRESSTVSSDSSWSAVEEEPPPPKALSAIYKHHCSACGTGRCARRKIPASKIHDVSDGNTVSTRNSFVTNSSIDKTDYVDRDEDFSAFEIDFTAFDDDDDDESYLDI